MIGKTLAHYEILSKLGEGGMGVVYRAHDARLGRDIALKILPQELCTSPEFKQRFELEVRSLAALRHPNIVTVHSFEETEGVTFYTMEFVSGQPLDSQIPARGLPLDRLLRIAASLCDAVAHAHAQGITHRDLKPSNIMLDQDDQPKVLDFGLAKLVDREAAADARTLPLKDFKTGEGRILGTVAYMSPEQAEGKPIDHRSDIFSMGVVLYEMATGRRPFGGDTPVSTISSILKDAPSSITSINRRLPRHLWRIVKKCLEKEPIRRYPSAIDLRNDLEELADEIDSGELTVSPPSAASGGKRALNGWIAAILAIGIVGAGILGYHLWRQRGPVVESGPVQLVGAIDITRSGKVQTADLTPDGRFLVYSEQDNGRSNLRVLQLATNDDIEILPPEDGEIQNVRVGPRGDHAFYLSRERETVYRISLLGGTPQPLLADVAAYALSPDSRRLAFVRSSATLAELWVADIATGQQERLLGEFSTGFAHHLVWSEDGQRILYNSLEEQGIGEVLMQYSMEEGRIARCSEWVWGYVDMLGRLRDGSGYVLSGPGTPGATNIQAPAELWLLADPSHEPLRLTYDPFDYSSLGSDQQGERLTALQGHCEHSVQVLALENPAETRQVMHTSRAGRWWVPLTWTEDGKILYPALAGRELHLWEVGGDGSGRRRLTFSGTFNICGTLSPDGRTLAYVSNRDGSLKIYLRDRDGGQPRRLSDGTEDEFYPEFSPDGQWIVYNAFTARQAGLRKTRVADGRTVDIGSNLDYVASFSPDGRSLSCLALDTLTHQHKLSIASAEDGRILQTFAEPPQAYPRTRWTPDGGGIVHVRRSRDVDNLWLQPLDGAEPSQLTRFEEGHIAGFDLSAHGDSVAVATLHARGDVVMFDDYREQLERVLGSVRPR